MQTLESIHLWIVNCMVNNRNDSQGLIFKLKLLSSYFGVGITHLAVALRYHQPLRLQWCWQETDQVGWLGQAARLLEQSIAAMSDSQGEDHHLWQRQGHILIQDSCDNGESGGGLHITGHLSIHCKSALKYLMLKSMCQDAGRFDMRPPIEHMSPAQVAAPVRELGLTPMSAFAHFCLMGPTHSQTPWRFPALQYFCWFVHPPHVFVPVTFSSHGHPRSYAALIFGFLFSLLCFFTRFRWTYIHIRSRRAKFSTFLGWLPHARLTIPSWQWSSTTTHPIPRSRSTPSTELKHQAAWHELISAMMLKGKQLWEEQKTPHVDTLSRVTQPRWQNITIPHRHHSSNQFSIISDKQALHSAEPFYAKHCLSFKTQDSIFVFHVLKHTLLPMLLSWAFSSTMTTQY